MRKLAKYLSILPLALLLIVANSMHIQANEVEVSSQEIAPPPPPPPQKKESKSNEVFVVVDKQPEFPGGTKELMKFLGSNIEYPKEAQEKRIEGRVILSFIVEKDGSVTDVEVVRGQDPLLDAEATRVITLMPKWTPGELKEETVRVKFNLPIVFRLPKTDSKGNIVARYQQYENKDQTEIMVIGSGSMDAKPIQSLAEKFGDGSPLIIVDDVKMEKGFELNSIMPTNIESITVLKDKSALEQYGKEGKDGAIIVTLKDRAKIQTTTDKEEIFVVVEDQPQFPGGTEALMQYLGDNINYPKEAHEKKIEGRVIVNFVINEDGSISEVSIVRGVDPLLDAEAIRVISAMPNWKPGMQRGQAVRVRYTLPISFNLQDGKDTKKETIDAPDDIFVVVEQQPEFPGGMEAMMTFLGDNIKYPAEAQKNRVQGRVIVNFVVNKDGSLSDMKVVRGQDPSLDAEAIRVIATMPNWKPGMQRGEAVNVRFTLPIVFRLKADKDVETDTLKDKESPTIVAMKNDASEKAFHEFIGKNARYPVIAQENGIMGFVKASYDVNSNGEVSNIKIVEGVDPALDKELTRIIEIMPKDIALIKSGGKAASNVEISAVFRLQNGDTPPPPPVKSDVVVVGYGKPAEGVGNKANKGIQKKPSIVSRRDQKTDRKFYEFISQRIKYPAIAQENSITGVVRASYDVDSNGEISNIKITKGVDPLLDAELKRVIQLMPNDVALMRTKGKAASNVALSANFIFGDAKMHEVRSEESDLVVMGYRNPIE